MSSKQQPELVAHHFAQGGQNDLAMQWWGKAGDAALRRSSFQEAVAHLGKAIEMADGAQTPQVARLRSEYRRAVSWGSGQWSDRAVAAFGSMGQDVSSAQERGAAYYSEIFILMARHWGVGDLREAIELGENASRQLQESGQIRWERSLGRMIGINYALLGECQVAYTKLREVADYFAANPEGDDEPLG